jgi:hypothetical protein
MKNDILSPSLCSLKKQLQKEKDLINKYIGILE